MVAFNFRGQFIEAVETGRKRQTIRDTLRPGAYPGAAVQLYYGLRTKACRLLGAGVLDEIWEVEIGRLSNEEPFINLVLKSSRMPQPSWSLSLWLVHEDAVKFAQADGFESIDAFMDWFLPHQLCLESYRGFLYRWTPGRSHGV